MVFVRGVVEVELGGAGGLHDGVEDGELTRGQGADHDATRRESHQTELGDANLLGNVNEAAGDAAPSQLPDKDTGAMDLLGHQL